MHIVYLLFIVELNVRDNELWSSEVGRQWVKPLTHNRKRLKAERIRNFTTIEMTFCSEMTNFLAQKLDHCDFC